jgi:predicted transposase/invertase (TIGR01784 family)
VDRINIMKSFNRRLLLGLFALGLMLNASRMQASSNGLQDDVTLSDCQAVGASGTRLSQKRVRSEMSDAHALLAPVAPAAPSSSSSSSSSVSSSSSSSSSGGSLDSAESEGEHNLRRTRRGLGSHSHGSAQTYAVPTYDGTFKHLLSHEDVLQSFLETFIPDENVRVVRLLDAHLRPFSEYEKARSFLNSKKTIAVADKLSGLLNEKEVKDNQFNISFTNAITAQENSVHGGSEFIKGLAEFYDDILCGYPLPERNSQVDVLCEVDGKYYAIVEMQISEKNYWDKRALAYAANRYGRQLRKSQHWDNIKKVICINILGGSVDKHTWKTHTKFRKFTFKDQYNKVIDEGIEIFQYPLYRESVRKEADKRKTVEDRNAFLEWIEFFEHADNKSESDMSSIKTDEVRQAYELIKTENLPHYVLEKNREQEKELSSQYSERMKIEREEERTEIAKKLMASHIDDQIICDATGLPLEQIAVLRSGLSSPG